MILSKINRCNVALSSREWRWQSKIKPKQLSQYICQIKQSITDIKYVDYHRKINFKVFGLFSCNKFSQSDDISNQCIITSLLNKHEENYVNQFLWTLKIPTGTYRLEKIMFQYIKYLGTRCFFSFNLYKILKIIIIYLVLNKHRVTYLLKIKLELQKSFVRSFTKNGIEQRCNPKYSLVYFYDQLPLSSYINHFFSLGFFL